MLKLQASSIARIKECPGSAHLEAKTPYDMRYRAYIDQSEFGTKVHAAAEASVLSVIKGGKAPTVKTLLKAAGLSKHHDKYDNGINAVKEYTKYFKKILKQRKKAHDHVQPYLEYKLKVPVKGVDCVFKTDAMLISQTGENFYEVDIMDLKTGNYNYSESAYEQMMFSMEVLTESGMFKDMPDNKSLNFNIHVIQPNYFEEAETVVTFSEAMTVSALRSFLISRILGVKQREHTFTPGDHCKFCSSIVQCPVQNNFAEVLTKVIEQYPDLEEISYERLEGLWLMRSSFETFLKAIDQRIGVLLEQGWQFDKVYKKQSYGHRYWLDEEKVISTFKYLGEGLYNKELKSPAQLEKLAGKANVADLYGKPIRYSVAEKEDEGDIFGSLG